MRKTMALLSAVLSFSFFACGNQANTKAEKAETNQEGKPSAVQSGTVIPADTFGSGKTALYVTLVGHGSFMFEYAGRIIQVDPYSPVADYSKLPKADLILLTHEHGDHLDQKAIADVRKENTGFITSQVCHDQLGYGEVMKNGDKTVWNGISIEAVTAYNIVHKKPDGEAYHPKGRGNGYILTFGERKVYVSADTENIPEMDSLKGKIDIAFLPKNLPYTMTDEMFIDAAKKVSPKVLYPCHFSEFDKEKIGKALEGTGIELRIRPMKNR